MPRASGTKRSQGHPTLPPNPQRSNFGSFEEAERALSFKEKSSCPHFTQIQRDRPRFESSRAFRLAPKWRSSWGASVGDEFIVRAGGKALAPSGRASAG